MILTVKPRSACSAIAPPARQTKSAEWALTTSALLSAMVSSAGLARSLAELRPGRAIPFSGGAITALFESGLSVFPLPRLRGRVGWGSLRERVLAKLESFLAEPPPSRPSPASGGRSRRFAPLVAHPRPFAQACHERLHAGRQGAAGGADQAGGARGGDEGYGDRLHR